MAFVELLAGARRSEQEFRIRRATANAVFLAELPIDWQFPEAKVVCAYPQLRTRFDIFETRCASLEALVHVFCSSKTINEFSERASNLNMPETLGYFERFDEEYGIDYLRSARVARQSKKQFDSAAEPVRALGLPPSVSHAEYMRTFRASELHRLGLRYAVATAIGEIQGMSYEQGYDAYFASYDGSIDAYLAGVGWWNIEHALGREPNRNDAMDLAHLLYLVPGATLVTADRAFAHCAKQAGIPCQGPDSIVAGA
jgi:hypothetical protein